MDKRAPDNRSIGVFDSGMGGLTAVRRLHALMPKENIIYFCDTSRLPYGTRGRDTIVKYARQDVAFLRQFDLKAIVIACNTVSSVALDLLAEENNIPIIGTVEPACRRAMTMTKNGRVGVIGTGATSSSGRSRRNTSRRSRKRAWIRSSSAARTIRCSRRSFPTIWVRT